jgi:hypothetical protein
MHELLCLQRALSLDPYARFTPSTDLVVKERYQKHEFDFHRPGTDSHRRRSRVADCVTEVGIFFFSEQREVAAGRSFEESLTVAGQNRMRPIAMTTIAAILTLLPLAFAIGAGSEMQQPLAIAIVSGLVVQLPLVLLAMPAFYSLLSSGRRTTAASTDATLLPV